VRCAEHGPGSITKVAEVVADPRYAVAEGFSPPQLQSLLVTLRESALRNLERGFDPLGIGLPA
jgi:hypothetical protein